MSRGPIDSARLTSVAGPMALAKEGGGTGGSRRNSERGLLVTVLSFQKLHQTYVLAIFAGRLEPLRDLFRKAYDIVRTSGSGRGQA